YVHETARITNEHRVGDRQLRTIDDTHPDARVVDALQIDRLRARTLDRHRLGERTVGADDDATLARVRAEEGVRVRDVARDEALDLLACSDHSDSTAVRSRRSMPATGIFTQSGRWLSS